VTRFTRATGDCFALRGAERRFVDAMTLDRVDLAPARVPRFLADRVDFRADDLRDFDAMDQLLARDRATANSKIQANTVESALLSAAPASTMIGTLPREAWSSQ
jgi:hypothetical protein